MTDLRYALRSLRQSPVFTSIAVLSLALGIGANTCIFSIVNGLMLKSLPVKQPSQLVLVAEGKSFLTNPQWEQLRDRADFATSIGVWGNAMLNLAQGGEVHRASGYWVSGDYFRTLGVQPAAGRLISAADDHRGCPAIAVLGYSFWQREFGGDPAAVGKSISLDGSPFQIVGVTQEGYFGMEVGRSIDVHMPICSEPALRGKASALDHRSTFWLRGVARLKPGISMAQVSARLAILSPPVFAATVPSYWNAADRATYLQRKLTATAGGSGVSYLRSQYENSLRVLMAVVGVVLLIACTNVANLLLARGAARSREIAVRLAIGASRARLIRQLLTESVLLSLLGAAAGALIAAWGSPHIVGLLSSSVMTVSLDVSPDARVLGGSIALALVTAVLFGIAPAWRSTAIAPNAAIKESARGVTPSASKLNLNRLLVVSQLALSLLLLIGAGLLVRTFTNLLTLDPGFDRRGILIASLDLHKAGIPKPELLPLYEDLRSRFRALPGVEDVSYSGITPISGSSMTNDDVKTDSYTPTSRVDGVLYINYVSPGYFQTLGTPLLAGRDVSAQDTPSAPEVAVINETMAKHFFPGVDPIGKTFRQPGPPVESVVQVIGIVKDAKYTNLRAEVPPTAFFPWAQESHSEYNTYEIRLRGNPAAVIPGLKELVASTSRSAAVEFKLLTTQVNDSLLQERSTAMLSGAFGALAIALAAIGLYGVLAYIVARRRNEIGIRMALGAPQPAVIRLVLREVAALTAGGIAAGCVAALAAANLLQKMLYHLKPADPLTIGTAVAILIAIAGLAGFLPARQAAQVDPLIVLRDE